jgi:hypothetical protein
MKFRREDLGRVVSGALAGPHQPLPVGGEDWKNVSTFLVSHALFA